MNFLTDQKKNIWLFVGVLVLFMMWNFFTYTQDESKNVVVTRFGKILYETKDPGLHFRKAPWPLNSVNSIEKRFIIYDSDPKTSLLNDKKTLLIDMFGPVKITNPSRFLKTVGSLNSAQTRIDDIIYSRLKNILGRSSLKEVVVTNRENILDEATRLSNSMLDSLGMHTGMVRTNRVDLATDNRKSVIERMKTERQQIAQRYRSEGKEEALKITSKADKEVQEISGRADKEAMIIIGKAEAEVIKITNAAYGIDPSYSHFYMAWENASKEYANTKRRIILDENDPVIKEILTDK